ECCVAVRWQRNACGADLRARIISNQDWDIRRYGKQVRHSNAGSNAVGVVESQCVRTCFTGLQWNDSLLISWRVAEPDKATHSGIRCELRVASLERIWAAAVDQ